MGADGLAMPPVAAVFDNAVGTAAALLSAGLALGLLLWGTIQRTNRWIIAAMLWGGGLTSLIEPLLDVDTGALHPMVGQPSVFTLMGRGIPSWVVICYAIYYGGFGSLNLIAFGKGIMRRGVWLWFLAPLLGDVALEEVMLHFNLYYYYGNQPFVAIKFPLYQAAGNSVGELLGVTVLFFLRPWFRGWRWFAACSVIMPLCGVMGLNGVCWPSYYAVNSTWSNGIVQLCGMLTWILAAAMVYGASLLVAVDSPLRRSGKLVLN